MNAEYTVLLGIAVAVALAAHVFIRRYLAACAVCAVIAILTCLVQMGPDLVREPLPPVSKLIFWLPFGLTYLATIAWGIAAAVGLPFYLLRRKRRTGDH
jgi:hypothetical protein